MGWNSWDCYYSSDVVAYTTDGHAVDVDINWPEGSKTLVLGTMEATTSTTITAIGSSHAGVTRWQRGAADGHNGNESNTPNRAVSYCPKSDISNPLLCIFCEIFLSVFHEKAQINVILQHTNSIKQ